MCSVYALINFFYQSPCVLFCSPPGLIPLYEEFSYMQWITSFDWFPLRSTRIYIWYWKESTYRLPTLNFGVVGTNVEWLISFLTFRRASGERKKGSGERKKGIRCSNCGTSTVFASWGKLLRFKILRNSSCLASTVQLTRITCMKPGVKSALITHERLSSQNFCSRGRISGFKIWEQLNATASYLIIYLP